MTDGGLTSADQTLLEQLAVGGADERRHVRRRLMAPMDPDSRHEWACKLATVELRVKNFANAERALRMAERLVPLCANKEFASSRSSYLRKSLQVVGAQAGREVLNSAGQRCYTAALQISDWKRPLAVNASLLNLALVTLAPGKDHRAFEYLSQADSLLPEIGRVNGLVARERFALSRTIAAVALFNSNQEDSGGKALREGLGVARGAGLVAVAIGLEVTLVDTLTNLNMYSAALLRLGPLEALAQRVGSMSISAEIACQRSTILSGLGMRQCR